jgi:hypothetical protein
MAPAVTYYATVGQCSVALEVWRWHLLWGLVPPERRQGRHEWKRPSLDDLSAWLAEVGWRINDEGKAAWLAGTPPNPLPVEPLDPAAPRCPRCHDVVDACEDDGRCAPDTGHEGDMEAAAERRRSKPKLRSQWGTSGCAEAEKTEGDR